MKITPDTKIKDVIPEGYEFNNIFISVSEDRHHCKTIEILIRKKEEKNFEWYVNEYYKTLSEFDCMSLRCVVSPLNWKFEFKIGLFKFICDSLFPEYGYDQVIADWKNKNKTRECFNVFETCPEEFLNSLIK